MSEKENFVSRWSRLKRQGETDPQPASSSVEPLPAAAGPVEVELPPVESLTMDSDFSVFMRPEVDESLRRTALRKLLRDPHFNAMDGLDVYIDDYGKPDPIPAAMLSQLAVVKRMLQNSGEVDGKDDATVLPETPGGDAAVTETPASIEPNSADSDPKSSNDA